MTDTPPTDAPVADPGRRRLLSGLALGGGALAGGLVGGTAVAATTSGGVRTEHLALEVALIGESYQEGVQFQRADDADFRAPFVAEGWIYPGDADLPDGFVPTPEDAIGRWFCHGWNLPSSLRAEPHVLSTQEYVFGLLTPDELFPTDALTSSGLEGATTPDWVATRSITGGTGQWMGASGQVLESMTGFNTSVFGNGEPGMNFHFEFELLLPE